MIVLFTASESLYKLLLCSACHLSESITLRSYIIARLSGVVLEILVSRKIGKCMRIGSYHFNEKFVCMWRSSFDETMLCNNKDHIDLY